MNADIDLKEDMFSPAIRGEKDADKIRRPSIKYWPDVWRRLKQNKLAMTGLALIIIMIIMAAFGPKINGFKYYEQDYEKINLKPNDIHWFGTDELGRDLFTRTWYGARYSLFIGVAAVIYRFCNWSFIRWYFWNGFKKNRCYYDAYC